VIFKPLRFVQAKLHIGPRETKPVILAITPEATIDKRTPDAGNPSILDHNGNTEI
jgi:hypothetical protein